MALCDIYPCVSSGAVGLTVCEPVFSFFSFFFRNLGIHVSVYVFFECIYLLYIFMLID